MDVIKNEKNLIPVGISQCLLGEKVRYDGGHKRSPFCTDVLAEFFEFTPVCPEAGAGLGIPRPAIRLVKNMDGTPIKVVGVKDVDFDVTTELHAYTDKVLPNFGGLCGYILMQKSPSCGMERVPQYRENGAPLDTKGVGVYAEKLMKAYPLMPVEEAGRLHDAVLCENFISRVYAYERWKSIENELSAKKLIDFYSDYKYVVMAHDNEAYHGIGKLLSFLPTEELQERGEAFIKLLMITLKKPATRRKNTNVLMHIQGYFKKQLDAQERRELTEIIHQYRHGDIPLVAPLILLKHHLKKHPDAYLQRQKFLTPYPDKLRLRNAI
jgi:uncharacterized protein YbgA (DUF1722 family)/uncharacterized protein YbbK (DUF523 family)